ncbi:alpha/beta fold hydrolase [Candidatus Woesearchaeota archaeon]|nr:alpha/beta fold hydrolase [Candidatus Woesearchaeota archaeon]
MNIMLQKIIKNRGKLIAIIVLFLVIILSKFVNELGVDYIEGKKERNNGIMIGAEPFFIQKGNDVGVLMLHGFSSSPRDFHELANFLAEKNITVYAPLLPGHGTHPKNLENIEYQQWTSSVQESLNKINTKKKFIIGYSMGGALALHLASKNELDGVITINAAVSLANKYIKFISIIKLAEKYTTKKPETIIQFIDEKRVVYDSIPLDSVTELQELIDSIQLQGITEPILILQSNDDRIVLPESARILYDSISSKDKELIFLENSTHSKINNQNEVFKKLYEFIQMH